MSTGFLALLDDVADVKADDLGISLAARRPSGVLHKFGRFLVVAMPVLLQVLSVVGTAAMLWVGGGIVLHGLDEFGWGVPAHAVHDAATAAGAMLPAWQGVAHRRN